MFLECCFNKLCLKSAWAQTRINHFSPSGVIAGIHGRVEVGSQSQVSRQLAYAIILHKL